VIAGDLAHASREALLFGAGAAWACVAWSGVGRPRGTHDAVKPRNAPAEPQRLCDGAPGSEFPFSQLLEHVDIQRLLSHELLQPLVPSLERLWRLASSAFIPP